MKDQLLLGNRLRNFRKRYGLSQMDLEIKIEASPGSISRMENGEVNPTKETIYKISDELNLTNQERQFLYGSWFYPANDDEVQSAIDDTSEYFSQNGTLGYILDERFRFITISKSFQKFLGYSDAQVKSTYKQPFLKLILEDNLKIKSLVPPEEFESILRNLLASFYADCGFMVDDDIYLSQLDSIKADPLGKKLWEEIIKSPIRKYNDESTRKVIFKIAGFVINMHFIREPLYRNRRFEIVEYVPEHKFIKFISKLIM
ncbi:MAG: helix-turn-helix transcriptional regulator [Candidatus Dojkabacteria bacterium]